MQIEVKRFCEGSRVPIRELVNVVKSTTYEGHDIYRCSELWYYVQCCGEWQYFGTLSEARRFIRDTYWG